MLPGDGHGWSAWHAALLLAGGVMAGCAEPSGPPSVTASFVTPALFHIAIAGPDAAQAAPFTAGKLGAPDDPGELVGGIPFLHLLALDQHGKHGLDMLKPLFKGFFVNSCG